MLCFPETKFPDTCIGKRAETQAMRADIMTIMSI